MARKAPHIPLPALCADFLDDCRMRNRSPHTVEWYEDKLLRFTAFAHQHGARYLE